MKKFVVSMMMAATTMSALAQETAQPAQGASDTLTQTQALTQPALAPVPAPAPATGQATQAMPDQAAAAAPAATPQPSPGTGGLGGVLLGLGLGTLLSHFGIDGAMASTLSTILMLGLLALAALFMYRMVKRKDTPANSSFAGLNRQPLPAGGTPDIGAKIEPAQPHSYTPVAPAVTAPQWNVPPGFDNAAFLQLAKSSFIRMQAAWDKADTDDLKQFTTPQVFAELRTQIQDRGQTADATEVVSIDAELLGIETLADVYLASVKFVGMIKSSPSAAAEPFAEVWNMSRPLDSSTGWVLAGIQQLS